MYQRLRCILNRFNPAIALETWDVCNDLAEQLINANTHVSRSIEPANQRAGEKS
jgi:hypothetical protein